MNITSTVDQSETEERLSKLSAGLVCPVCKKQAAYRTDDEGQTSYIGCEHCKTKTASYGTMQEALNAWANKILY